MRQTRPPRASSFEARSVALIASWTLAGAALAQTTSPPPKARSSGPATVTRVQAPTPAGSALVPPRTLLRR